MGNFSFCLQSISLIGYNDTNRSRRAYGLNCLRINTAGLLYLGVKITNMKHKPYLTIDEQIKLLSSDRGLIIDDINKAKEALLNLNYYRLSGYSLTLRKNNKFYKGTHFDDILQIYNFDRDLRVLIFSYLEDIEISLRSHVATELGKQDVNPDDTPAYLKQENYNSPETFYMMQKELPNALGDNKNEAFVKHHKTKYNGILPTWAIVETLSFGKLSKLFASLNIDIQKNICKNYYDGLRYNTMQNWLEGIVVLRNLCAHRVRLFNRGIVMKPKFPPKVIDIFSSCGYDNQQIGNKLFFRLFIITKLSSNPDLAGIIKSDIINLCKKYPFVNLSHYGFIPKWEDLYFKVLDAMSNRIQA